MCIRLGDQRGQVSQTRARRTRRGRASAGTSTAGTLQDRTLLDTLEDGEQISRVFGDEQDAKGLEARVVDDLDGLLDRQDGSLDASRSGALECCGLNGVGGNVVARHDDAVDVELLGPLDGNLAVDEAVVDASHEYHCLVPSPCGL